MSLRRELTGVLARDPRYAIHAYAFVLEALETTKALKKRGTEWGQGPFRPRSFTHHVSGRELC